MIRYLLGSFILLLLLSGCTGVASLAQTLNERAVTSCLWYTGSYGPFVGIRGVTATGGTPLDTCLREGH